MRNVFDFFKRKTNTDTEDLYLRLCKGKYVEYPFQTDDLGEGMAVVKEVIMQYWKPRYLLDHAVRRAYEFMSENEYLQTVKQEDIAWEKLTTLPLYAVNRAKERSAHYPTQIGRFKNGVAEVRWELNPDGYYFMDDDGFGMTDDEEITIYALIDRRGAVVAKFQPVNDSKEWAVMKEQAEKRVKENKKY